MWKDLEIGMRFKIRKEEFILAFLALVIVTPILYKQLPAYLPSPDILYVKAKVLQVLRGKIFTDPITGYDTMHPPLYHLFLAPFKAIGMGTDFGLIVATIFNVVLLIFFTFKVIETAFDRTTGLFTALMIPFIIEFMGCRNILLATSFHFSLPFYLVGLWMYLRYEGSLRMSTIAAILWGVAFLLSPVYIFLLATTFLYEALVKKRIRRLFVMAAAFGIIIIPFFVQAINIYSKDLWGSRIFAFWRGFPAFSWFGDVIIEYISPEINELISVPGIIHLFILSIAIGSIIVSRKVHWFLPLLLIAYLLTAYHFNVKYASRIQIPLSIFIVAAAISNVKRLTLNRYIWIGTVTAIATFALYQHFIHTVVKYLVICDEYVGYREMGGHFWHNMDDYLEEDRYIFCNKDIYLKFIMPYFPAHALAAYNTMDYFQLKAELSDMLYYDYQRVMSTRDYDSIEKISLKYNIEAVVITGKDVDVAPFETLLERWLPVYRDRYFAILRKPNQEIPVSDQGSEDP